MSHPTTEQAKRVLRYNGHLRLVIRLYDVHITDEKNKALKRMQEWPDKELYFMLFAERVAFSDVKSVKEPAYIDSKQIDGCYVQNDVNYYISIDPVRNVVSRYKEMEVY